MAYKLCLSCGRRAFQKLSETVYQCRDCGTNTEQLMIPFQKKARSRRKRSGLKSQEKNQ